MGLAKVNVSMDELTAAVREALGLPRDSQVVAVLQSVVDALQGRCVLIIGADSLSDSRGEMPLFQRGPIVVVEADEGTDPHEDAVQNTE